MANDRKCLFCGRILVDEKMPCCTRCEKQGFKAVKDAGKWVAAGAVVFLLAGLAGKKNNEDVDETPDGDYSCEADTNLFDAFIEDGEEAE